MRDRHCRWTAEDYSDFYLAAAGFVALLGIASGLCGWLFSAPTVAAVGIITALELLAVVLVVGQSR